MSFRDEALKDISTAIGMSNFAFEEDYKNFRKSCGIYEAYAEELDWEEDCNDRIKKAQEKEDST